MAGAHFTSVYRQIGRLFGTGTVAGLSEGQLLERFIDGRDDGAFEAIVTRYGPTVLSVCRSYLDDPNDADDAFQAVFLVLVRRASTLRHRDRLGGWLYGVAHKVARRARAESARRRGREALGSEPVDPAEGDAEAFDIRPLIHDEIRRLPSTYREAVVLCYFEGRTHEEAARELGWPVGTVRGRLARARDLLRGRLARRGIAPAAGALAAALCREGRTAVSPSLLHATTSAAAVASGSVSALSKLAVSAQAFALSHGALETMSATKLKLATTCLVAAGVLTGSGVSAYQAGAGGRPTKSAASQVRPAPGPARERVRIAQQIVDDLVRRAKSGEASNVGDELATWRRRLFEARLAAGMPRSEAAQALIDGARDDVATAKALAGTGNATQAEVRKSEFRRLEAEELLAQAAAPPAAAPPAPAVQAETKAVPTQRPFPQQWDEAADPAARLRAADALIARMELFMASPSFPRDARKSFQERMTLWKARRDAAAEEVAADRALAESQIKVAEQAIAELDRLSKETDAPEDRNNLRAQQEPWKARIEAARQTIEGPDYGYRSAVRALEAAKAREAEARTSAGSRGGSKLAELQAQAARITAEETLLKMERARRAAKAAAAGANDALARANGVGGPPPKVAPPESPRPADVDRNKAIEQKLEKVASFSFPSETPLRELIGFVQEQTRDAKGKVIPIYVDPVALQEAEKTMESTITMDLDGVPIRVAFRLALAQLDLFYRVKEGMIFINCRSSDDAGFEGDPPQKAADLERNKEIEVALDKDVAMPFANETPLTEVVKHIREATRGPGNKLIPVYVDPIGLQEAEKTLQSPISLNLADVPLRTTLRLVLAQIGMEYKVEDGLLKIVAKHSPPEEEQNNAGMGGGGFGGGLR